MKTGGFTTPRFDGPECLGEGGSGAWYDAGIIPEEARSGVIAEVLENGGIEPIRDSKSLVAQVFKRAVIDLTREHLYPKTEALGLSLAGRLIVASEALFPAVKNFRPDKVAVQIYPAGTELGLGWHRDHINHLFAAISATLAGSGDIVFSNKPPKQAREAAAQGHPTDAGKITTNTGDAVFFSSSRLYLPTDLNHAIRRAHAVTNIGQGEPRFSLQFRMEVNAGDYDNTPVNHDQPKRSDRPGPSY